jgi:CRISPR-associated endonuclease/helicase Cas3
MTAIGIPPLSEQVRSAWAKHRRDDDASLSLVLHCEDAAAVAAHLWDDWIPRSTREYLTAGRSADEARVLARWLAGVHDVGKLSPAFAIQVPILADRMRDSGLTMKLTVPRRQDTPHSVVSHRAINKYLIARGWSGRTAATYAVIAGGHHGVPPSRGQLAFDEDVSHYGRSEWTVARNELLDHITAAVGAEEHLASWAEVPMTPQQQVLWTGFVIMADWIASSDHFPLSERRESEATAAAAWAALQLPPPWTPSQPVRVDELMRVRFELPEGAQPNSVQRVVVDAVRSMAEPGLVVIEAPMGIGKTEAALMAAESLAAQFGQGGVFVALPTMATSNAMFKRVLRWIESQNSVPVASAVLAHGKASLEDSYRGLLRSSRFHEIGRDAVDDEHSCQTEVIAHYWLSGRKKGLLADFAVGTIDQLLFAGLKARHLVLRHLALVNKVVIVDEVHAADTYMMQYLIRVLEWLGAYRVPVVLMSATLPSSQRLALVKAYESGRGWADDDAGLQGNIRYPVVTVVDGSRQVLCAEWDCATTQVELERLDDDLQSLIGRLDQVLDGGGCVGIVRNTVGRAQETARALESHFPGDVVLLHSRFVAQHRADLESALVSELGPRGSRPQRRIVVGTQVIEQSLDIDFDLLVSDLCPIDLLFQRAGRLHRHQRGRPESLRTPRLILTGVEDWSVDPPSPVWVSARIYGEFHLLRTLLVLEGRDYLILPSDIAALVEAAYGNGLDAPPSWRDQLESAKVNYHKHVSDLEDRARKWRIWEPQGGRTLVDWLAENVGDVDDARGQAKVRDTDEGIEVILTQRIGDEVHLLERCRGGGVIVTNFCPDDADARRALTGTVRLPQALTHPGIAGKTIESLEQQMYPGWQESKWLAGELVLELDADLRTDLMDYHIRYDDIEGLVVTRNGDRP